MAVLDTLEQLITFLDTNNGNNNAGCDINLCVTLYYVARVHVGRTGRCDGWLAIYQSV